MQWHIDLMIWKHSLDDLEKMRSRWPVSERLVTEKPEPAYLNPDIGVGFMCRKDAF
jgi:hypothetical protein